MKWSKINEIDFIAGHAFIESLVIDVVAPINSTLIKNEFFVNSVIMCQFILSQSQYTVNSWK